MSLIAPLLALKKIRFARRARKPFSLVLVPETLLAGPRLNQRPVHREVFVRQIRLGLPQHPLEEGLGNLLDQQKSLAECIFQQTAKGSFIFSRPGRLAHPVDQLRIRKAR